MTTPNPSPDAVEAVSVAQLPIAHVPVTVQVLLGTAKIPLSDLLKLSAGAIIQLDQRLGEEVLLIVNGCRIARGELYVLDEVEGTLGVKVTAILDRKDTEQ